MSRQFETIYDILYPVPFLLSPFRLRRKLLSPLPLRSVSFEDVLLISIQFFFILGAFRGGGVVNQILRTRI